jgi:hypothetical protein
MAVPEVPHSGHVGRGPGMEVVASKESWKGGGGGEGVPAAAACEGNENWEVIQAERRVPNL